MSTQTQVVPPRGASVFSWLFELKARALEDGIDLIDLGIGSPDRPAPPPITQRLAHAVTDERHHGYPPFRGTSQFLHAASRYMERRFDVALDPSHEIQCVSGAEEAFMHLALTFLRDGGTSLIGDIHYPIYARSAQLTGADISLIPLTAERGFIPDLRAIPTASLNAARMLIVNYPHNPTGATAELSFFEDAVAFCREHKLLLVSDLAYSELTFDGFVAPSVLQVEGAKDVAIELHSFSKSFNMAGFRIAFAAGSATALDALYRTRSNCTYGTPTSIQEAAAFALDEAEALVPDVVSVYRERRDVVARALAAMGYTAPVPRATMFMWVRVPDGYTSHTWVQRMVEDAGVVATPGDAFGPGGEGWFRISLVAEVEVLEEALSRMGMLDPAWSGP